jgi:uncharacterized membrane protein (DUF373 family)
MSTMPEEKERPSGIAGVIWTLEHAQDLVSVVVDFFRDVADGPVETAVINVLNRILLVLILVEIMHTVVLSLRAHHLVTQPLLAVGLVAVIRKILFVLSSEEPVSTAELALLIAMIAVFVAALIVVSRYDPGDSAPTDLAATVFISAGPTSDHQRRDLPRGSLQHGAKLVGQLAHRRRRPGEREVHRRYDRPGP